jgi:hypothetical protein
MRTQIPEIYGDLPPAKNGSTAAREMNDVRNSTIKGTMVQNAIELHLVSIRTGNAFCKAFSRYFYN